MYEKLLEKLSGIREELSAKREVSLGKLENLKTEARQAFDETIDRWYRKRDISSEMKENKKRLSLARLNILQTLTPFKPAFLLSAPFIYGMIIPSIFLHITFEIYQQVCFRIYGIPLVSWRRYFVFDRAMLPYLNWFEKFNCFYCEYVNCLLQYVVEIAGRTERFWCPIKHARRMESAHSHYPKFVDYLDGEKYHEKADSLRDFSDIHGAPSAQGKTCDFVK